MRDRTYYSYIRNQSTALFYMRVITADSFPIYFLFYVLPLFSLHLSRLKVTLASSKKDSFKIL